MKAVFVGNGSWGQALANVARENGHDIVVLARDNSYSPISDAEIVMLCVPSYALREVCGKIKQEAIPNKASLFIGTSKGIEPDTLKLPWEIVCGTLEIEYYAHLGGPGFAKGILEGEDTRLVVTTSYYEEQRGWPLSNSVALTRQLLENERLKIYATHDLVGLEIIGACRTTLSIVMGAAKALSYDKHKNTMAAVFGRTMVEISRFVRQMGGHTETLLDVAGSGDLYLCNDEASRNFQLGEQIAGHSSKDPEQRKRLIETDVKCIGTVEGFLTSKALWEIAQKYQIDAPWTRAVYQLCHLGSDPQVILSEILQRQTT